MRFSAPVYAALLLLLLAGAAPAGGPSDPAVGVFSHLAPGGSVPPPWEPLRFDGIQRQTVYTLALDEPGTVIRAESSDAASGLIRRVRIDPGKYPWISWSWKVDGPVSGGDLRKKAGDDYAARLYITFRYEPERFGFFARRRFEAARLLTGSYPPGGAINYIWGNRAPVGTVAENAYEERVRMIVIRSGAAEAGRWHRESRNIVRDHIGAFGTPPPMITAVAIMTDTDNTGGTAAARYGDIRFHSRMPPPAPGPTNNKP